MSEVVDIGVCGPDLDTADALPDHWDDPDDEIAWRLRVTGSDAPPPRTRADIIREMEEIALQYALEVRAAGVVVHLVAEPVY